MRANRPAIVTITISCCLMFSQPRLQLYAFSSFLVLPCIKASTQSIILYIWFPSEVTSEQMSFCEISSLGKSHSEIIVTNSRYVTEASSMGTWNILNRNCLYVLKLVKI